MTPMGSGLARHRKKRRARAAVKPTTASGRVIGFARATATRITNLIETLRKAA